MLQSFCSGPSKALKFVKEMSHSVDTFLFLIEHDADVLPSFVGTHRMHGQGRRFIEWRN